MEKFWLKPAFNYTRPIPLVPISEPPITEFVENKLLGGGTSGSTPSGFAMRQLLLLLLGLNFAILKLKENKGEKRHYFIISAFLTFTAIVIFSRVYRVSHTVFDIGIAFGVTAYLFWLIYTIFVKLFDIQPRHFLTDMTGASFIFLPLFFFYSRSATQWTLASIIIFTILGFVHYVPPVVQTTPHQNEEEE